MLFYFFYSYLPFIMYSTTFIFYKYTVHSIKYLKSILAYDGLYKAKYKKLLIIAYTNLEIQNNIFTPKIPPHRFHDRKVLCNSYTL